MDRKKYLGYAAGFKILENLKRKLSLNPRLTLHSPRVGSATDGARLGVSRSVLMQAGHWNSNAGGQSWSRLVQDVTRGFVILVTVDI